ncbi:hypothetical protein HID58_045754, partial [Brassica napus]
DDQEGSRGGSALGKEIQTEEKVAPRIQSSDAKEKTPEKLVTDEEVVEIEEGEVVEGWANVSPEKSGSQKRKPLKFGQVKIATRFSALADADDDGNLVEQAKESELEAGAGDTEAAENTTSLAVNEVTGVKEVTEVTGVDGETDIEVNGKVESVEESLEILHTPTNKAEQAVMRSELAETFAEKVKKGMSAESTGASVGGKALLPSLPRVSKTNHRGYINDTTSATSRTKTKVAVSVMECLQHSPRPKHVWKISKEEADSLGEIHHPKLVKLLGYCYEDTKSLLVFEYSHKGSLHDHIFGKEEALPWETRVKIAIGVAEAIAFLHSIKKIPIHQELHMHNIMLDENVNRLKTSEFMEVIGNYWKDTQPLFQSTSALYRFSKYFKGLKPHIRSLSKNKLGSLTKRVKEAFSDLCMVEEGDQNSRIMPCPNSFWE